MTHRKLHILLIITTIQQLYVSAYERADSLLCSLQIENDTLLVNNKNSVNINQSFKAKHLIIPASLIAVGTFGVYNGYCRHIENSIKNNMDNIRGNHYFRADDYIQYVPIAAYLGLDFIGIKAKHHFKERLSVGLTSYLTMSALVNLTKYTVKEKRPNSSAHNSFPSGHTATVFTGAELIREEYGTGIGIAAYSVASGVAFLRLYNGRHWLNDIIAGAGFGILSARIGYWMLPLYQKWFGWNPDNTGSIIAVVPYYDISAKSAGLNFGYVF